MCRRLVYFGAQPDHVDNNGQSPLFYAVRGSKIETINFLLDNGAEVNMEDKKFMTPLSVAKRSGKPQVINLLVSRGAKGIGSLLTLAGDSSSHKKNTGSQNNS